MSRFFSSASPWLLIFFVLGWCTGRHNVSNDDYLWGQNTSFDFERELVEWVRAPLRRLPGEVLITPCMPSFLADFTFSKPQNSSCPLNHIKPLPLMPTAYDELPRNGTAVYLDTGELVQFSEAIALGNLRSRIVLIVGRWQLHTSQVGPRQSKSQVTTKNLAVLKRLLSNTWIMHIFMQNPEFAHPDYEPLPYGMHFQFVVELMKTYAQPRSHSKTNCLWTSPAHFSPHRIYRPEWWPGKTESFLNVSSYIKRIQAAFFVASPGGDRYDCYRHWEVLAVNAKPVSNLPSALYKNLFCNDMVFIASAAELHQQRNVCRSDTHLRPPNREKLLVSYWKHRVSLAMQKSTKGIPLSPICE